MANGLLFTGFPPRAIRLYDNGDGSFSLDQVAAKTTAIAAGVATDTVVKNAPGRLFRVLVTTTGTNPMLIYDNASGHTGTVIGALPASPAVGAVYDFELPAANGITVQGNAANPAVTVSWA